MKNKGLIYQIYRSKGIERINKKIKLLGIANNYKLTKYLACRLIFSALIFIPLLFINYGYLIGPILGLIFWYGYEYVTLDLNINRRRKRLEYQAVFFFESLILPIENKANIENALTITSENIENELAFEFRKALEEMKVGKTLFETINSLKERIPSSTINNTLLNISQANKTGINLSDTVKNQIKYLRKSQILDTKETISKLPIKISLISVIMFIPIIFLLILGPTLVKTIEENKIQISEKAK